MGQLDASVRNDSGDDIETDLHGTGAPFGQPLRGSAFDPCLLLITNGLLGEAPSITRSSFHFTEDDESGAGGNDVDLDPAGAVIALDRETGVSIQIGRSGLAGSSNQGALVHP